MSNIRVFLKKEVENVPGFEKEERGDITSYSVNGVRIWKDSNARWYVDIKATGEDVPATLQEKDLVDGVSLYHTFPARAMRERGIYTHKTATAELELDTRSEIAEYEIHVAAKNVDDLRELLRLVKSGDISPKSNYDGPPMADTRAQEVALKKAELERSILRKEISQLIANLKTGFPLCFKKEIIKILKRTLGE